MQKRNESRLQLRLSQLAGLALASLGALACSGAGADSAATDLETDDAVASTELGLRAPSGVPALSWRGAPPTSAQTNSNQAGLQVVHAVQIGVSNKTVVGLNVCWYTPSNPNNLYTNGDPTGCNTVGASVAGSWTTQQCPAGEVMSGYYAGLNRNRDRIAKYASICRSLSDPSRTRTFGFVGDSSILFADRLDCTDQMRQSAYLEYFSANPNFTGFNGVCVLR